MSIGFTLYGRFSNPSGNKINVFPPCTMCLDHLNVFGRFSCGLRGCSAAGMNGAGETRQGDRSKQCNDGRRSKHFGESESHDHTRTMTAAILNIDLYGITSFQIYTARIFTYAGGGDHLL